MRSCRSTAQACQLSFLELYSAAVWNQFSCRPSKSILVSRKLEQTHLKGQGAVTPQPVINFAKRSAGFCKNQWGSAWSFCNQRSKNLNSFWGVCFFSSYSPNWHNLRCILRTTGLFRLLDVARALRNSKLLKDEDCHETYDTTNVRSTTNVRYRWAFNVNALPDM